MSNLPDPALRGNSNNQIPISKSNNNQNDFVGSQTVSNSVSGSLNKEQEPLTGGIGEIQDVGVEEALPKELEQAGIVMNKEQVDVPPDVQQMGIHPVGANQSVVTSSTIILPLTDDQIVIGLHAQILSSFRWLAEWCIRRLKKLHIHLKNIGGEVVREGG